ncbi:MAG: acyl-CoA thioesterase [Myxococcales bacterium]|nr:acyl-CoA thioesterase [Myxococcales bacterium]
MSQSVEPEVVLQVSAVKMRVAYAETDRMGFLHHSNHLRWFERGREEFCRRRLAEYRKLEDAGTLVVVADAQLEYKVPLEYEDVATLTVSLVEVRHATLRFRYVLTRDRDGVVAARGSTRHAFLTRAGRVTRVDAALAALLTAPEAFSREGEL